MKRGGFTGVYILSPAMQQFLASLLRIAAAFRGQGHGDRYLENLWILYMNLPPEAKEAVNNSIAGDPDLSKYGSSMEDFNSGLQSYCRSYLQRYIQFKDAGEKRAECNSIKIELGDRVLMATVNALFHLGLLSPGPEYVPSGGGFALPG